MSRSKTPRKRAAKVEFIAADDFIEFTDPPGGMPLPPKSNGKRTRGNGRAKLAKRDRLRPLVSMIGNCMTLARHIDSKGLDDVVEAFIRPTARPSIISSTADFTGHPFHVPGYPSPSPASTSRLA